MKNTQWLIASLIAVMVSVLVVGCGGGSTPPVDQNSSVVDDSGTTGGQDDNGSGDQDVDARITQINSFFNIELGNKKSWYWVGSDTEGHWQETDTNCEYQITPDGKFDATNLTVSHLRSHYTIVDELDNCDDQGDSCLYVHNCSLDNNYELGEGFRQYNDQQLLGVFDDRIELGAVAYYNDDGLDDPDSDWGWIRTPGEIMEKALFPQNW